MQGEADLVRDQIEFETTREILDQPPSCAGFSEIRCQKFGVSFAVRTDSDRLWQEIHRLALPPGWEVAPETAQVNRCFHLRELNSATGSRFEVQTYRYSSRDSMLIEVDSAYLACLFLGHFIQSYLVEKSADLLFLHAGVVAWNDVAIMLPGDSFAGKSTLVAALLKKGAAYLTDDHAILNRKGEAVPFPNLISIRESCATIGRRRDISDFSERVMTKPLPVGLIAFVKYFPDSEWAVSELSPQAAALELFHYSYTLQVNAAISLPSIRNAVDHAVAIQGTRGDAELAADQVIELVESAQYSKLARSA